MPTRPINEREKALLARMRKRVEIFAPANYVEYLKQGNFTICLAYWPEAGPGPLVGVAKRLPTDEDDAEIGCDIAFARAVTCQAWPVARETT